jgi:hypothetical protein
VTPLWPGPAPHDLSDVPRPDRQDDPILAADDAVRQVIAVTAYQAWRLSGSPAAPIGRWLSDRTRNPRPGDLCFIPDALARHDATIQRQGFGYLLVARLEPCYTAEDWQKVADQYEGDSCPLERVFYLQYGPRLEDVCRWENATCQAIPYTLDFGPSYDEPLPAKYYA